MTAAERTVETRILPAGDAGIAEAARLVREGFPVAVPTETVYGLAADATKDAAIARIYEAKGRPSFNPLIVHVADIAGAEALARVTPAARAAMEAFWPGALTLVLPRRDDAPLAAAATAGLATVALRCPSDPVMQALLAACGKPLAAPSANRSGSVSPTTAAHVARTLEGRIPLILDGGETRHGIESTIVAITGEGVRLLRAGPVPAAAVASAAGLPLDERRSAAIEAPGQLESHYAPSKPLRLDATEAAPDEWLIGFGPVAGDETLSASGDLAEAAARLYAALHRADLGDQPRIAVAPLPHEGLGGALNDRLRRAAAPRR